MAKYAGPDNTTATTPSTTDGDASSPILRARTVPRGSPPNCLIAVTR